MVERNNPLSYAENDALIGAYEDVLARLPEITPEIPCTPPPRLYKNLGKALTEREWNKIFLAD